MNHYLVRALIIPEIVKLIAEHEKISELQALERFYTSRAGKNLANDQTGLYGQSILFNYGLYLEEQDQSSD